MSLLLGPASLDDDLETEDFCIFQRCESASPWAFCQHYSNGNLSDPVLKAFPLTGADNFSHPVNVVGNSTALESLALLKEALLGAEVPA